jgi:hypothetical protein
MLPLPIAFLIATIASAINERVAGQLGYAQKEVRTLKEAMAVATGTERIRFTEAQRRRLVLNAKALTPRERAECCQIVRPETILAWFRHWRPRGTTARRCEGPGGRERAGTSAGWSSSSPGEPRGVGSQIPRPLCARLARNRAFRAGHAGHLCSKMRSCAVAANLPWKCWLAFDSQGVSRLLGYEHVRISRKELASWSAQGP